jgi:hypothetical protein
MKVFDFDVSLQKGIGELASDVGEHLGANLGGVGFEDGPAHGEKRAVLHGPDAGATGNALDEGDLSKDIARAKVEVSLLMYCREDGNLSGDDDEEILSGVSPVEYHFVRGDFPAFTLMEEFLDFFLSHIREKRARFDKPANQGPNLGSDCRTENQLLQIGAFLFLLITRADGGRLLFDSGMVVWVRNYLTRTATATTGGDPRPGGNSEYFGLNLTNTTKPTI